MTTKAEMIALAKEKSFRRLVLDSMGMQNVANRTVEERIDINARYQVAQDEYASASKAYEDGLRRYKPEPVAACP